ncbi:Ferredoxin, 2Fe-2S [Rubrobacter xylanophilus DSM 9941]|nr:Ferredoxin, 2Fe-2S [Rubrobacter xylanophilus DSM 9941]
MRPYDAHVLLCRGGDCKKRGSKEVRKALKAGLRAAGLNRDVRVDSVDCLGFCKYGPNAVVYGPNGRSGTWYLSLDEGKVPEVVNTHLKGGNPVEHLAADYRPRRGA